MAENDEFSSSEDDNGDASLLDDLNEDQHQTLIQFQEITATDDFRICRQKLEAYNWNLESAVHDALNESEGLPPVYSQNGVDSGLESNSLDHSQHTLNSPIGLHSVDAHASAISSAVDVQRRTWFQWLGEWILIPYRFTFSVISDIVTFIRRFINTSDPVEDVAKFKRKFEAKFGLWHPTMYQGTYSQVLNDAKKELKFLLVYLHSDDHQDTPIFCREVLCNSGFKDYVNGNMLFWACDVNSFEGYRVSRAMRESTYPFLAVVCLRDNRMTIVWRIEGLMEVDRLIALFARIMDENDAALIAAKAERAERSASQQIRQEQDEDYLKSLQADQQKERLKREEDNEKQREEQKKQEKILAKQRKIEDIACRKEECRRCLEDSPQPCQTDQDALRIRVKLSDGTHLDRFFLKSDKLKMLYDFVFSHEKAPSKFVISSTHPKRTYQLEEDSLVNLEDVGLISSAALFVQDITEDSSDDDE